MYLSKITYPRHTIVQPEATFTIYIYIYYICKLFILVVSEGHKINLKGRKIQLGGPNRHKS